MSRRLDIHIRPVDEWLDSRNEQLHTGLSILRATFEISSLILAIRYVSGHSHVFRSWS